MWYSAISRINVLASFYTGIIYTVMNSYSSHGLERLRSIVPAIVCYIYMGRRRYRVVLYTNIYTVVYSSDIDID